MKSMLKKSLPYILMFCMSAVLIPANALAISGFPDMPAEDNWAYAALQSAVEHGILAGDEQGRLKPSANTTRAQAATIINRVFGAVEEADISSYTDVSPENWYYSELAKASQMRTFLGYGTKLYPNGDITREQLFVALARAISLDTSDYRVLDSFSDGNAVSDWAKGPLAALVSAGYVNGDDGKLKPQANIRREELAQVLYNTFQQYIDQPGTYTKAADGNIVVSASDVTLKDLKVSGDLILGDGVGNGDFTLDNVAVAGRVIVRGGGENSVKITNRSSVGEVIVAKAASGGVRVLSSGGASVGAVRVGDGTGTVKLEGAFREVRVTADTPLVLTEATVSQLTVSSEKADVSIQSGSIASLSVAETASSATITTGKDSSVGTLTVASSATLDISGAVTQLTVSESAAAAPTLALSDTAKVSTLTVAKGADVTVQTDNAKAIGTIKSDDAKSVTVVSDNSSVKSQIESKSESGSSSSGGSSSGHSSHTTSPGGTVTTTAQFLSALDDSSIKTITVASSMEVSEFLDISKPVTVNAGVTLTFSNQINLGSTLTNNGTVYLRNTYFVIDKGGRLTNNGVLTCNAERNVLYISGMFDSTGTVNSALTLYAAADSTVLGYVGTVLAEGEPDTYTDDGARIPGKVDATITAGEGVDIVSYAAVAYGTDGLAAALASDAKYSIIGLEAAEGDAADVSLSGKVSKPGTQLSVADKVALTVEPSADARFYYISAEGKLRIGSDAKLTVNGMYLNGGELSNEGTLVVQDRIFMKQGAKGSGLSGQEIYLDDLEDSFFKDGTAKIVEDYVIQGEYTVNESYSRVAIVYGSAGMTALAEQINNGKSYQRIEFCEAEGEYSVTLPSGLDLDVLHIDAEKASVTIPENGALTAATVDISNGSLTVGAGAALTAKGIEINGTLVNMGAVTVSNYLSVRAKTYSVDDEIYTTPGIFNNQGVLNAEEASLSADGKSQMLGIPAPYTVYVQSGEDTYNADGTIEIDAVPTVTGEASVLSERIAQVYGQTGLDKICESDIMYDYIWVNSDSEESLTLSKPLTVRQSFNVEDGIGLTIPSGVVLSADSLRHAGDLTIADGGQLKADSNITLENGTITNNGTIICNWLIISDGSGTTVFPDGSMGHRSGSETVFTNNGSIVVGGGSYAGETYIVGPQLLAIQSTDAYWGNFGEVTLADGATLRIDSIVQDDSSAKSGFYSADGGVHMADCYIEGTRYHSSLTGEHDSELIRWTGSNSLIAYDYVSWKTAVTEEETVTSDFPITLSENITLKQAAFADSIIIPAGKTLTVEGFLECRKLIIDQGGKLVVDQDGSARLYGLTNNGTIQNGGTITLILSVEEDEPVSDKIGAVTGNAVIESIDTFKDVVTAEDFWAAQENDALTSVYYYGDDPLTIDGEKTMKKQSYAYAKVIVPNGTALTVSNLAVFSTGITVAEGGTLCVDSGKVCNLDDMSTVDGAFTIKSGTIQVLGKLQLKRQVNWEESATITVDSNAELEQSCAVTIPKNGTLNVYGTYYIGGTLTNAGFIDNSFGKVVIRPTGSLTNNGSIAEIDGDHLEIIDGGTFTEPVN